MDRLNYFNTREECKKFLDRFKFKYFIPYLEDFTTTTNRYHVELNELKTVVIFCQIESIANGLIRWRLPFYDYKRPNDFITSEEGESRQYDNMIDDMMN